MKKIILWTIGCCFFLTTAWGKNYDPEAATLNAKLGLAYLSKGMYSISKQRLLSALRDDPDIAISWYCMAYFLEKTGNMQLAGDYFKKAVLVEPHSGSALNNLGTFLCRNGNYEAGIQVFLKAATEPSYLNVGSAYENAGTCALMIPDNTRAMNYFKSAIDNNPEMSFSVLSLARLNHLMGNQVVAMRYFNYFKKISMQGKSAIEIKKYQQYVFSGKAQKALPMPKNA